LLALSARAQVATVNGFVVDRADRQPLERRVASDS
jgi:hypothetical protein